VNMRLLIKAAIHTIKNGFGVDMKVTRRGNELFKQVESGDKDSEWFVNTLTDEFETVDDEEALAVLLSITHHETDIDIEIPN